MSRFQSFSEAIDTVYTDARYDLGTERYLTAQEMSDWVASSAGPGVAIFVGIAAAGSVLAGSTVSQATGTADWSACVRSPVSTSVARVVGVAQHIIALSSFGWILKRGFGEVLGDSAGGPGYAANVGLIVGTGTAGRALAAVALVDQVFGWSTEAAGDAALGTCYIDCR